MSTITNQIESIYPLYDRVIVRPNEKSNKTDGGITMTTSDKKDKESVGQILYTGEGKYNENGTLLPLKVKVGDYVMYGKFSGTEIEVEGEELLMLRESDIFCIVTLKKSTEASEDHVLPIRN